MSAHPQYKRLYTVEEYFELEEKSDIKHEYYRGEIFAMSGGSVNHNRIARNVLTALDTLLRDGPCEPFGSDLRTLIDTHTLYTYPDVTVVCGGVDSDPKRIDTITNPRVIVEVLSPSTQTYDQRDKFTFYRTIPSLQEYVLIHQDRPHVIHHRKQDSGWLLTDVTSIDASLVLDSCDAEIPLRQIYRQVDWLFAD